MTARSMERSDAALAREVLDALEAKVLADTDWHGLDIPAPATGGDRTSGIQGDWAPTVPGSAEPPD
jgi:hypothetical protein